MNDGDLGGAVVGNDACTRVLLAIVDSAGHPWPPSIRELGRQVDRGEAVVHKYVERLVDLGLVTHEPHRARTLRPLVVEVPV